MTHSHNLSDSRAFAGFLTDTRELRSCTSGGIATALSRNMIRQGGVVAGVAYTPDFYGARYELASDEAGIQRFKGSKYIEVQKGTIYQDVEIRLEQGQPVLFFGLPCAVSALKSRLHKEYPHLFTVALICHGPTYPQVHRQYIAHLEGQFGSKVTDFTVRRKETGWTPAYLYARFASGEEFCQKFNDTAYGKAFYALSKGGCYACPFRSRPRNWDLTIGDYWGAREEDPFWNENGVSAILTHTDKGLQLLSQTPQIRLFDTTLDRILAGNPLLISSRTPHPHRDQFLSDLQESRLFSAASSD